MALVGPEHELVESCARIVITYDQPPVMSHSCLPVFINYRTAEIRLQ